MLSTEAPVIAHPLVFFLGLHFGILGLVVWVVVGYLFCDHVHFIVVGMLHAVM